MPDLNFTEFQNFLFHEILYLREMGVGGLVIATALLCLFIGLIIEVQERM